jgi:hypothetical protein
VVAENEDVAVFMVCILHIQFAIMICVKPLKFVEVKAFPTLIGLRCRFRIFWQTSHALTEFPMSAYWFSKNNAAWSNSKLVLGWRDSRGHDSRTKLANSIGRECIIVLIEAYIVGVSYVENLLF